MTDAAAPYADPLIFLFMGGFLQALSMQRWGLDKRIALATLRRIGTTPTRMVGGFMLVTATLSAFVSNTATAAMMLPIGLSVVTLTLRQPARSNPSTSTNELQPPMSSSDAKNFATCLMLGIAYAASIGGVTTIIGTPPNVFLVGFLKTTIAEPFRMEMSFLRWLAIGIPFTVVFLPIAWWLLTRFLFPIHRLQLEASQVMIENEYRKLGPASRGEWMTFVIFFLTASAWIARPWLTQISWEISGQLVTPLASLTDGGIAMTGALLLFVLPARTGPRESVMNWTTAEQMPWGILILFGGGISLAAAIEANGVAEFVGCQSSQLRGLSDFWLVVIVIVAVVFLTELTSNIATTATLVPVFAAMAPGLDVHPYLLVIPVTMAASSGFMLPIATPPNAMVFATRHVTIGQMARAGFCLNLISIVLITLLTFFVIKPLMGI